MPEYIQGSARSAPFVLSDGEYRFKVDTAEERLSPNNNEMIKLKLAVLDPVAKKLVTIWTQLVFTAGCAWMIDGFRSATGDKIVKGERVELSAEDCLGREGYVVLSSKEFDGVRRNVVKKYVGRKIKDAPASQPQPAAANNRFDEDLDDLPFLRRSHVVRRSRAQDCG
jgi:hypothetical protein